MNLLKPVLLGLVVFIIGFIITGVLAISNAEEGIAISLLFLSGVIASCTYIIIRTK
ncbi:hypothetical protein [Paramaledivibacter caminithermalis]|uniref:Uncharacterized protein n=1 Tax=Paramaledivibacter caminithermalis (strain DSM 15212 / CIP 107654 / DViRD3) TaxID=1121301 RepID=A0A1M6TPP7_PARC5|nr:hypothetical protein [Paramaledivibacter caminithermalis]SHK58955.1 hypothetical protein SAMN02745912_03753 [Paramaledivibacter caminithermalis DSM 15212]